MCVCACAAIFVEIGAEIFSETYVQTYFSFFSTFFSIFMQIKKNCRNFCFEIFLEKCTGVWMCGCADVRVCVHVRAQKLGCIVYYKDECDVRAVADENPCTLKV